MTITRTHGVQSDTLTSITLGWTPTNGETLVMVIGCECSVSTYVTSITQTHVAWTKVYNYSYFAAVTTYLEIEIWYGKVSASPSTGITIAFYNAPMNLSVLTCEYSGIATTGTIVDAYSTNSTGGSGTTCSTGKVTQTNYGSELWVGGIYVYSGTINGTPTNGFTQLPAAGGTHSIYLERIATHTGSPSSSDTFTSTYWNGFMACFVDATNPITHLTTNDKTANYTGAGASSLTLTFDATPTNGNVLVCSVGFDGNSAHKPLGSLAQTGVTWVLAASDYDSNYFGDELWFGLVGAGASTSLVITVYEQDSPSTLFSCVIIEACAAEFTMTGGSGSYLDQSNYNTTSGSTTATTGSITTTIAAELLCGGISDYGGGSGKDSTQTSTNPLTPTFDFIQIHTGNIAAGTDRLDTGLYWEITSATGSFNTGCTIPTVSATAWGTIAGFNNTQEYRTFTHTFSGSKTNVGAKPVKTRGLSTFHRSFSQNVGGKSLKYNVRKWTLLGTTRNSNGVAIGNCKVLLFLTASHTLVTSTISDSSGAYSFTGLTGGLSYYVLCFKAGTPDIFGTTDDTLS